MRFAALMLVALSMSFRYEDARVVGLVVAVQGEWKDDVGQPVRKGSAVWNHSLLRPQQSAPDSPVPSLEVRSYVNGEKVTLMCDNPPCGGPVSLGKLFYLKEKELPGSGSGSFLAAISAVLSDLIGKEDVHTVAGYTRPLSKGLGGQLSDGVLAIDGGSLSLAPVFRGLSGNKVQLEFCPVAKDGSSICPTGVRQDWVWQPDHPTNVETKGLKPGLYEVAAYSEEQSGLAPVRLSAMILIVRRSELEGAAKSYQEAVQQTETWTRGEQSTARRLYLQYLNSKISQPLL